MKNTLLLIVLFTGLCRSAMAQTDHHWHYLFNGQGVNQLRGYKMDSFPTGAWKIEDGALAAQAGVPNVDLVSRETYTDFDLTLQWKTSVGGNSGIFYNVQENSAHEAGNGNSPNWLDNFEMQLLDDIGFNDHDPRRSAGSLYDLIAPQNKHLRPVGQYNTARLRVNHGYVEQWINGSKVVEYQIGSPQLNTLISQSKYKDNPNFAKATSGHLMFQHHGQQVWLKDIRVRRL